MIPSLSYVQSPNMIIIQAIGVFGVVLIMAKQSCLRVKFIKPIQVPNQMTPFWS